jgi:hypothetical protein
VAPRLLYAATLTSAILTLLLGTEPFAQRGNTQQPRAPKDNPKAVPLLDQQTATLLFTAGIPRQPRPDPDLRALALELLESPARLRETWAGAMPRLEDEGFEAGEFALLCRLHLNMLDNCAALLEVASALTQDLQLPAGKVRQAVEEVEAQLNEVRPLFELATSKPPPLDPAKLAELERKYAGQPAIEVGELIRQVESSEVQL